jgi:hypothetical protein
MTLHERRLRRAQEESNISNLLRRAHAIHWGDSNRGLQSLDALGRAGRHRSTNDTWTYGVDANLVRSVVDGIATCH